MRSFIFVTLGVVAGIAVSMAQGRINPTDPQPTCPMCPGYYIPASELGAYTKYPASLVHRR